MESLVALPDGTFATTEEGYIDPRGGVHQPAARPRRARRRGDRGSCRPRPHFAIVASERSHGVRHNLGLESLTRTPDGRLISGTEQPLAQDGPVSDAARGGRGAPRGVRAAGRELDPGARVGVRARPDAAAARLRRAVPRRRERTRATCSRSTTRGSWPSSGRACVGAPGAPAFNPVRLHLVDVGDADDVSALPSLAGASVRPARKRLLLDLTTLMPRLPPALATLSNFEGIAAGPAGTGWLADAAARQRRQLPRHPDAGVPVAETATLVASRAAARCRWYRGLTPMECALRRPSVAGRYFGDCCSL